MKKNFIQLFTFFFALVQGLTAQNKTDQFLKSYQDTLLRIYEHIHQHPELSGQEEQTAALVASRLRKAGYTVHDNLGKFTGKPWKGFGVVALMKNGEGPTVMVRADMDALPIEEKTNLSYSSKVTVKDSLNRIVPVMHACGHDLHTTILAGIAEYFAMNKNTWKGTLMMVAQPSEEGGPGASGAQALIEDGLFTRFPVPDYILGLHQTPELAAGTVGIVSGHSTSTNAFGEITVKGIGGHPAKPHNTKDAIVITAELIMQLQTIVSRETNPIHPATITIGSVHGGNTSNVICDEVTIKLSMRALNETVLDSMISAVRRICRGIAITNALPESKFPVVKLNKGYPSNYNDPSLAEKARMLFIRTFGDTSVMTLPPSMTGEDFAYYSMTSGKPGLFFQIGGANPEKLKESQRTGIMLPSNHSATMSPEPAPAIRTGIKAMAAAIHGLMNPVPQKR